MESTLISANTVFEKMILRAIRWGFLLGIVCGIIGGFPIFGIGALFGMFIGPVIGVISGIASGFILSIISLLLYSPLNPEKYSHYRIISALVCVAVSLIAVNGFAHTWFHMPGDILSYVLVFIVFPAILAAIRSSQSLAAWYIAYNISLIKSI